MLGIAAAYVAAISAMLFAAISALALIYTVEHLDAPETPLPAHEVRETVGV
jgi:hypothetical protein